jgi:hypothetical protein
MDSRRKTVQPARLLLLRVHNRNVDDARHHVTNRQRKIQQDLRGRARHAHRAPDDQRQKQPVEYAVITARHHDQRGEKNAVDQAHGEHGPLHQREWKAIHP